MKTSRGWAVLAEAENGSGRLVVRDVSTFEEASRLASEIRRPLDLNPGHTRSLEGWVNDLLQSMVAQARMHSIEAAFSLRVKKLDSLVEKLFNRARERGSVHLDEVIDWVAGRWIVRDSQQAQALAELVSQELSGRIVEAPAIKRHDDRGYRAIHLGVSGPGGHFIELQILTERMEAWSSVQHDRTYKPRMNLDPEYLNRLRSYYREMGFYFQALDDGQLAPVPSATGIRSEDLIPLR